VQKLCALGPWGGGGEGDFKKKKNKSTNYKDWVERRGRLPMKTNQQIVKNLRENMILMRTGTPLKGGEDKLEKTRGVFCLAMKSFKGEHWW